MNQDAAQLLYHEAQLLDDGRFDEWLALLAPDLRYWAPVRADLPRAEAMAGEAERLALFDETRDSLLLRVKRLSTGLAWSEIPPTRTRRMVANVVVDADSAPDRLRVRSNFILFRSRSPSDESLLAGCREDVWSHAGRWLLHARKITLDHRTLENLPLLL
jgi:3-phenylpropionate/cinnamic acid dioxygenase small subunit